MGNEQKDILELPQILDITVAAEFHKTLQGNVGDQDLTLDASGVKRITTPCIQLLIAASKHVESNGGKFKIRGVSDEFQKSWQELGLEEQLEKWE